MSKKIAIYGTIAFFLTLFATLFGVSWKVLSPTEVGLDYNHNTYQVDQDQAYGPGRYFLGLGHGFIVFPQETQSIRFQGSAKTEENDDKFVSLRTSDGLQVKMECSFQYRLPREAEPLYTLWTKFKMDYQVYFAKIARDVLRNAAANFTAEKLNLERTSVDVIMETNLNEKLTDDFGVFVSDFQLLKLDFPTEFSNAIQDTTVATEEASEAQNRQNEIVVRLAAKREQAESQGQQIFTELVARGDQYKLRRIKEAEAVKVEIGALLNSTLRAQDYLFNDPTATSEDLLAYLWMQEFRNHQYPHLMLAADIPSSLRL